MQLKKWIRDKWITGLLLCALSLSFFITLTGLEMYFNLQSETNAKAKETYNTTHQWKESGTESLLSEDPDTFLDLTQLDLKQANLFLYTDVTSVADSGKTICGNYFYCRNETLKKQFLWGYLSTEKYTIVINTLLEPYAYEKNGHWYVIIEQEEYEITGVVRSYSDETEGVFYTYYSNIHILHFVIEEYSKNLKFILFDLIMLCSSFLLLFYVSLISDGITYSKQSVSKHLNGEIDKTGELILNYYISEQPLKDYR